MSSASNFLLWWVIPGALAGMPMPFVYPERRMNSGGALNAYDDELSVLYEAGIRAVVSLLNIPSDATVYESALRLDGRSVRSIWNTRNPEDYFNGGAQVANGESEEPGKSRHLDFMGENRCQGQLAADPFHIRSISLEINVLACERLQLLELRLGAQVAFGPIVHRLTTD
jgi:hypothetical protein